MKRLAELRKEKGYTQVKMQMLTGIDQSNISKMELGIIEPNISMLKEFAKIFDTNIDYLIEFTDKRKPIRANKKPRSFQPRGFLLLKTYSILPIVKYFAGSTPSAKLPASSSGSNGKSNLQLSLPRFTAINKPSPSFIRVNE